MINKVKLREELLELLISAEYEKANPLNLFRCTASDINDRKDKALEMYRNDPVFHTRIESLVLWIMQIVDACEKEPK